MPHAIGIDFGTTKTLVSYCDPATRAPCFVRLGQGMDRMPTSVLVREDGCWLFGEAADYFMGQLPARYRRDFKLELGRKTPIMVAKIGGRIRQFTAKDLTARFLEHVRSQCETTVFHEPVRACVVTHPVAFSEAQRADLEEAARMAGFEDVRLLPEPEAAGYAYCNFGVDRSLSRLMVVDWGGGTVDFAMIALEGGRVGLVPGSCDGAVGMGGRKFDELLFGHLARKIVQEGGDDLEDDGSGRLGGQVRACKEMLSWVPSIRQMRLDGAKGVCQTEVARDEFDAAIRFVVDGVVAQLQKLIDRCAEKPQALLLIGGSSAIPLVRTRLQEATGLSCIAWDKVNEAVSMGAAWFGDAMSRPEAVETEAAGPEETGPEAAGPEVASAPSAEPVPPPARRWKSGRELEDYLRGRRILHEDIWQLYKSIVVLVWRVTAVASSGGSFSAELEEVGLDDAPARKVECVRRGLGAVDLGNLDDIVAEIAEDVVEMLKSMLEVDRGYQELYPGLRSVAELGSSGDGLEALKGELTRRLLQQLRGVHDGLCRELQELGGGFGRYGKCMTGSSFLDGFFGGADNANFVQSYMDAVSRFISGCGAFADQGASLTVRTLMGWQDAYNRAFLVEEAFLRALNDVGEDLEAVRFQLARRYRERNQEELASPEGHMLIARAVEHLRQGAVIPDARIDRMVEQVRMEGVLLTPDGALDAAVVQKLESKVRVSKRQIARFLEIVEPCRRFEGFYVMDGIPADKLQAVQHSLGNGLTAQDVLCLYEAPLFGGGFFITPCGIHWNTAFDGVHACAWSAIRSLEVPDPFGTFVQVNGEDVMAPQHGVGTFMQMFHELRQLFRTDRAASA